mgnify:CR=1 FL=1
MRRADWVDNDNAHATALDLPPAGPTARAAREGTRRHVLEALRDGLAAAFDAADAMMRPALAKQLRETMAELDSLPVGEDESASDDLAARARARRAAAESDASAAGDLIQLGSGVHLPGCIGGPAA